MPVTCDRCNAYGLNFYSVNNIFPEDYIEGKSILEHSDPQALVRKHGGTGRKIRSEPGEAGAKEKTKRHRTACSRCRFHHRPAEKI